MKTNQRTGDGAPINRRDCLLTLGAVAAAMSGCGGGGSVAGVSSGGTGSLSAGTITGFGSVFINGVKYEDGTATFTDGEGGTRSRDELQLGMVGVIDGSSVSAGNPSASVVSFGEEVVGRVTAIDPGAKTFVVLDQVIEVTGSTIFEPRALNPRIGLPNGFASLTVNDVVEVHGYSTPDGLQATRVQGEDPGKSVYRLQGVVSNLTPVVGGATFNIGTLAVQYDAGTDLRFTPVNGAWVRVRLAAATLPPVVWTATRISRPESALPDRSEAQVKGTITSFTTQTQFSVNGIPVNASSAAPPPGLATGVRVEVIGSVLGGTLNATTVRVEDSAAIDALDYELRGAIEARGTNTIALRGVTINVTAASPNYFNGDATKLATYTGVLEVRGKANTSGTEINATHISFNS
jgi:Domain of unknown function (DUF5666)